ncbi:cyclin-dependent kinase inhibitor 1Ba [Gasterosteus aculeatus]
MCNKMSEVRLSNASPTVERVDVRQPDAARPSVCKNLFGRPEPEEIRRDLAASIRAGVEDFKETYNFDPVADRPLSPIHNNNNNYDWQEDSDPPEFYVRQPHRGSRRPRGDVRDGRRDAGQSSGGGGERRAAPPDRGGSRKRASASGSCSSESMSKKSKDDCDDEEDPGAAGQALEAAEEEEEARVQ